MEGSKSIRTGGNQSLQSPPVLKDPPAESLSFIVEIVSSASQQEWYQVLKPSLKDSNSLVLQGSGRYALIELSLCVAGVPCLGTHSILLLWWVEAAYLHIRTSKTRHILYCTTSFSSDRKLLQYATRYVMCLLFLLVPIVV